jgi:DNA-binding MarR family transcriptional regulator
MRRPPEQQVRAIQLAYPQIWFACHREHRGRADGDGLTDREAGILMHLAAVPAQTATSLARHLGIGRPALSAQIKRLSALDLVEQRTAADARVRLLCLTRKGEAQARARSPLDAARVRDLLAALAADERVDAIRGLQLLAGAAQRVRGAQSGSAHHKED